MTRWWGTCEGCARDSDFLALLPGTELKVCVRCYEASQPARGSHGTNPAPREQLDTEAATA